VPVDTGLLVASVHPDGCDTATFAVCITITSKSPAAGDAGNGKLSGVVPAAQVPLLKSEIATVYRFR
jgi:hypothetical protein